MKPWHDGFPKIPRLLRWLVFLTCWPAAVMADEKLIPLHVYEQEKLTIYLMAGPCAEAIGALIRADRRPLYRALDSTWPMKDGSMQGYAGCWRAMSAEETGSVAGFAVVFSDGEGFVIPQSEFKKAAGQTGI
jgi:hypothetical protein